MASPKERGATFRRRIDCSLEAAAGAGKGEGMTARWPTVSALLPGNVSPESWDLFVGLVLQAGCTGFEERDPDSRGLARRVFLFFPQAEEGADLPDWQSAVAEAVRAAFGAPAEELETRVFGDEDWGAGWKPFFHRRQIGRRVYVAPPEEASLPPDAPADAVLVVLEYGRTFGTGYHETTQAIVRFLENRKLDGLTVLDAGSGSGVLALAALGLGAARAVAFDLDPHAEAEFAANAALSGVDAKARAFFVQSASALVCLTAARDAGFPPPDLVMCNMLEDEFAPLLPDGPSTPSQWLGRVLT